MSPYRDPMLERFMRKKPWFQRVMDHDVAGPAIILITVVGFAGPAFVLVCALIIRAWTAVYAFFGVQ